MGFLDPWGANGSATGFTRPSSHKRHSSRSRTHSHKKRRSRSRSRSSERTRGTRSIFGGDDGGSSSRKKHHHHNASRSSFFGFGDDDDNDDAASSYKKNNASRGSFFGLGNSSRSSFFGGSRSSYYKRSSRPGFVQKTYKQLKRLLRDLVHWAKRHPWKVFFLVIMPLVTGGALTALLARFGLRMPPSIERMLGVASRAASGDSLGLVGEAVRMASDLGGNGGNGGNASVKVQRQRTYDYDYGYGGYDSSSHRQREEKSWGGNLVDMAKRYL